MSSVPLLPSITQPGVMHAVVPMKPLTHAKTRLAELLTPKERQELALEMLQSIVKTLVRFDMRANGTRPFNLQPSAFNFHTVWVISADPIVLALAADLGAQPLYDHTNDLNAALEQVKAMATRAGADALLVLPADVPLVSPADLRALLGGLGDGAAMVIAPDRTNAGTNALGLRLPSPLRFQFGPHSLALHRESADRLRLSTKIYHSPTLALDIDTPEDLYQFEARIPQMEPCCC